MRLGEIKIEALKLMFANYNNDINIGKLQELALDENYASYLVNMPGAINRCFAVIENKGVLPVKVHELRACDGSASGVFTRFNLSEIIKDYFSMERLVYSSQSGEYVGDYDYQKEGETIVIKDFDESNTYTILYLPKIDRISAITDNETEMDIPDDIAQHIPYFIKGDLYRDDEPNEASEARNWFEAAMDAILSGKVSKTNKVSSIYKLTES